METNRAQHRRLAPVAIGAAGLSCFVFAVLIGAPLPAIGGALAVCVAILPLVGRKRGATLTAWEPAETSLGPAVRPIAAAERPDLADPDDIGVLVDRMLAQNRFALLLRPQIARNLSESQFARAREALAEHMALTPDGDVAMQWISESQDEVLLENASPTALHDGRVVRVERFFLDRHPITNRQYFEFVAAGGYRQMGLWEESVLPAMLDFVDSTGEPGPRFWKNGCYLEGREHHPVVGVSWHEAAAYARWVGKRLPTNAEWVKAASWPVAVSDTKRCQRRYPWGEMMDQHRANLWGSGPERTVAVDEFADGVSVGGVYQLIGNVWEWTAGEFRGHGNSADEVILETPMKCLRGGAFDTYFDVQATCQFLSGDTALARKRNIGFRLAVGVRDLVLSFPSGSTTTSNESVAAADDETLLADDALAAEEIHA